MLKKPAYDHAFYDYTGRKSAYAAKVVTSIVKEVFDPHSVCDVGCGEGVWLNAYRSAGVERVQGIDGNYVDKDRLKIKPSEFLPIDLSKPFHLEGRYDVSQSLEVAEHLPAHQAEMFVKNLTALSDIVVFSAAVPGQGGLNHINEQPLEYWRILFAAQGYYSYDLVRPRIALDSGIPPWYRFNILIYISDRADENLRSRLSHERIPDGQPIQNYSPLWYKARCRVIAALPFTVQQGLARLVS